MQKHDVRWVQRLSNYKRALAQLTHGVELAGQRPLSNLEKQGLIQAFEFCHELAWNVMKDYFVYQGNTAITGSRDAAREAFSKQLVGDGEGWMEMIKSRNLCSHTYNEQVANEIVNRIIDSYQLLLTRFAEHMSKLAANT